MDNDLIKAKKLLADNDYTCVMVKHDIVYTSAERGIKPLVSWYENSIDLRGFSAADKVVGKGAAFVYLLSGIKALYAAVISTSALELLNFNNVRVEYDHLVKNIINRNGDGICPFELAVLDTDDKDEAYTLIRNKMKEMNINQEV